MTHPIKDAMRCLSTLLIHLPRRACPAPTPLRWRAALLALLLLPAVLCATAQAKDPFSSNYNNDTNEFLPVEEAYTHSLVLTGNTLTVEWLLQPGYYLYEKQFAVIVDPANSSIELPLSVSEGIEKYDEYFEEELTVHYDRADVTVTLPSDSEVRKNTTHIIQLNSQGCADAGLCYLPQQHYYQVTVSEHSNGRGDITPLTEAEALDRPTSPSTTSINNSNNTLSNSTTDTPWLLEAILLALVGGAILNLMPCVFPVLSIKILSFTQQHQHKSQQHAHGWAYTAGVVITFVAIAAIMLALRSAGSAVGWGFQLQSPTVVAALSYLFFVMGLGLLGFIAIGNRWMNLGQNLTQQPGLKQSFFTGILASVVASPCTAPFMGTALGFAITQPAAVALLVFAALGMGMALPFLLLTYFPQLNRWLPKPGAWMDTFKQFLAFPLFVAAIWLLWVFARQTSADGAAVLVLGFTLIAFATWCLTRAPGWPLKIMALIAIIAALWLPSQAPIKTDNSAINTGSGQWQPYSATAVERARAEGRAVFVNVTADWCITCIANERTALYTDAVSAELEQRRVATFKGDLTRHDDTLVALLNQHNRSGVPLYLVYPADGTSTPVVLPQVLTSSLIIKALQAAHQP